MANRDLVVRFIGDDRQLQRTFLSAEKGAKRFQGRMDSAGQAARGAFAGLGTNKGALLFGSGAFVATTTLATAFRTAVVAASDLNEQVSRTKVIFGEAAEETLAWSRTTARGFGIAQRQALASAATFAGLFQTVGVGQDKAADLSQSLVELAADLASLQNSSPEDALIALRSGLVGESEPLRRFNIFLSEARVQQEALAATGKKTATSLTDQEKALARYNIILRDSIPAQGNFRDTSGELANQTRTLRANFDNLAANMGSVLLPTLSDAAEAANLLFLALDKFRGVDFSPGFEFPEPPDWLRSFALAPISPLGAAALGIKRILDDEGREAQKVVEAAGPGRGIGEAIVEKRRQEAEDIERAKTEAERERRRGQRAFADLSKGLGLKLDRAGLTASLDDDIAALRELERAIQRQIDREGRTFKLVEQLTRVRQELQGTIATRAENQARASQDAFEQLIGSLDLNLERAFDTERLDDDLRALDRLEQAVRNRIAQEGKTLELERQLLDIRRQQADVRREQAEQQRELQAQARERREGRQFLALGLTAEGTERAPTAGGLRARLGSLQDAIKGTPLDTAKTRGQLQRIARVLSGQFGKVGKDVREAIKRMLDEINDALKGGQDKVDPNKHLTPGRAVDPRKLIEGLGLSDEQRQELRRRIIAGQIVGPTGPTSRTDRGPRLPAGVIRGDQGDIVIETHIEIDGREIATATTKHQQKRGRRNPSTRRGRSGGRPHGL